ncbi:Acg family FMN-binding oxidoreductase [Streptomyces sp. GC420]|uniref:Acg family FMN-binding oxidoreductase n=1 Tax=Streptomyces sp. GC420 TaxID=2697568 RepID=UPI001414F4B4|nr:nitroreductase family protein [Streptomyces sp. GC420]NBM18841.1 nitroreductase [Streptomyces sp. GC420]
MPDDKTVTALVADATTAPSMHNAQPWKFRYLRESGTFELYADLDRAMPTTDPRNRALYLGCAAALFNLRVALAHHGLPAEVRLLPDPAQPELLATVRTAGRGGAPAEDAGAAGGLARLHPTLRRRHTSRYPYSDKDIAEPVRAGLREAARREGAMLVFPSAWHREFLLELVRDAEGRDAADPRRFADIERWTRLGVADSDTATEGIPEYAFGPRKRDGHAPVRDFAGRRRIADRGGAVFEGNPHLAIIGTHDDHPVDWLRAGQAMERVLLYATAEDLATSLTSHALEWSDLRELVRDPLSPMGFVQMVVRIGYGPMGPASPRRPVRDVLDLV